MLALYSPLASEQNDMTKGEAGTYTIKARSSRIQRRNKQNSIQLKTRLRSRIQRRSGGSLKERRVTLDLCDLALAVHVGDGAVVSCDSIFVFLSSRCHGQVSLLPREKCSCCVGEVPEEVLLEANLGKGMF